MNKQTNLIDITDLTDHKPDSLLKSANKTFRCPGCGCIEKKPTGWVFGMVCEDCVVPEHAGYHDDSWGDHNPYYDF